MLVCAVLCVYLAGYGKNLLSHGIQFIPKGLIGTPSQSRAPEAQSRAPETQSRAPEAQSGAPEAQDSTEHHVRLDKSNIILLGPTGCGEWVGCREGCQYARKTEGVAN